MTPTASASFEPDAHRSGATRALVGCGVVAGPWYLAIGLLQAFVREGFDLARHPLSLLANGAWGWVQTANFVTTGALVIVAAVGLSRVLGPGSRGMSWCLGGFGLAMLAAAVFPADPVDGFPPGTPAGPPTSISPTGLLHFVAGALGFALLGAGALLAARALSRRNLPALATLSRVTGLAVLVGFFGGIALPIGILGIWMAVVAGWAWLAAMSIRLRRLA